MHAFISLQFIGAIDITRPYNGEKAAASAIFDYTMS